MERPVLERISFGGGCHWCTEAVFQNIKGVCRVDQGYVASLRAESYLSEGVIVEFDPALTSLEKLIRIHLKTHSSTANHTMRDKYRSAIYVFSEAQENAVIKILKFIRAEFKENIITKVLTFSSFEPSDEKFRNYYLKDPKKPFCCTYIVPKIEILRNDFPEDFKK